MFKQIRQNFYNTTPDVDLEIAYRDRTTKEMSIFHGTATPKNQFPPNTFEKVYEVATVKVSNQFKLQFNPSTKYI